MFTPDGYVKPEWALRNWRVSDFRELLWLAISHPGLPEWSSGLITSGCFVQHEGGLNLAGLIRDDEADEGARFGFHLHDADDNIQTAYVLMISTI